MNEKVKHMINQDEEVIYFCKAVTGKIDKQTIRFLILFVVLTIFLAMLIISIGNHHIDIINAIIFSLIILLFFILSIYGFIYNLIIRDKKIKDNEYIITDKRIIIYNSKTDKLLISDINRINIAMIVREKSNKDGIYGDLTLHVAPKDVKLDIIHTQIFSPNPDITNANNMALEGIKNPREVLNLIKTYNSNIMVSDDRPTFLSKKY